MAVAAQEAELGYKKFHSTSDEWAWKFTILRATVLHSESNDEEALKLLATEPTPGPSGELAIKKHRLEGQVHTSMSKFDKAQHSFEEAEILCAGSDTLPCADVTHSRGVLEMRRGSYDQAQKLFAAVLPTVRSSKDRFWEASVLLDLSWSADEQTHFDDALEWANEARQIAIVDGFSDLSQVALGNMGWAYFKLGEREKSERYFVDARNQAQKLHDQKSEAGWLAALGYAYMEASEYSLATRSFQQSLILAQTVKSRDDIISARQALAFVNERTNNLDEAKSNADEALQMARADGNKRDAVYPQLALGLIAARRHDVPAAEKWLQEVAASPNAPPFLKWDAEHALAKMYEDQKQPGAAAHSYTIALTIFEGARKDLRQMSSRLPFLTNAESIYEDYIHFLIAQGKSDQALQVADFNRARTLTERLGLLPEGSSFRPFALNAPQLARRLGGTILFYSVGEKQSYLWAVNSRKSTLITLPRQADIESAVKRYHDALTSAQDLFDSAEADGKALYQMLVAPAKDVLEREASNNSGAHVFIVPDGSLNSLNFETLLVPDQKPRYWIEDVTISNAASLRMLSASRSGASTHGETLLLLGDAVSPNSDYPPLRNAGAEVTTVRKHFPSAMQQVLAGEQATPPAYLSSKPEEFSYIHFVAHGTDSRLSPLESAIVLSKATAEDDSFKLYARDIIHHKVRADLVTISACYGAGERAYSGEGLVGLSWAFLGAGAHNVIGALWDVSDASTPQLMDQLYDELKKGKTPEAALRTAKLSLLHSASAFRKPFYWAPFQLYTGS